MRPKQEVNFTIRRHVSQSSQLLVIEVRENCISSVGVYCISDRMKLIKKVKVCNGMDQLIDQWRCWTVLIEHILFSFTH